MAPSDRSKEDFTVENVRTPSQVMELAHQGEARAGSKCGRMDQCCALGTNHVAAMFFDGEDVQIYEVHLVLLSVTADMVVGVHTLS